MDISGSMSGSNSLNMRPLFAGYPFQGENSNKIIIQDAVS